MSTAMSRITRNFQVTLPKEVREREGLHVGDEVLFVIEGEHRVQLVKRDKDIIQKTAGLWKGMKETGLEYERRIRKEWAKREVS